MPTETEMLNGAHDLCCIPKGLLPVVKVWLLAQQLNPVPTAAEMIAGANTLCCIPHGLESIISIWLEGQIVDGGGGAGSGVVSSGAVDPVAAPADPAVDNWYINTAAGTGWIWPAGGAAWQQIV